jgi:ketosteroid isomerase-like protein
LAAADAGDAIRVADAPAEIQELLERRAAAIRARDVDGSLSAYAPDIVAFDLIEPLQYRGSDAVRKRLEQWFSSFDGEIGYENREVGIVAGEEVAFAHSLDRVQGRTTDGNTLDMWWRATLCFRRNGARWVVTHSHTSVPFDMKTSMASLELEP